LQPPGALAPYDTFLLHAMYSNPSQSISGVQLSAPVFDPRGMAVCLQIGSSATDRFGTVCYLCMATGVGTVTASMGGEGVEDATATLRMVDDSCVQACAAKTTACATYQCNAALTACVVASLKSGECRWAAAACCKQLLTLSTVSLE
jgi:hypothetical protein